MIRIESGRARAATGRWWRVFASMFVAALFVAACASDEDDDVAADDETTTTEGSEDTSEDT